MDARSIRVLKERRKLPKERMAPDSPHRASNWFRFGRFVLDADRRVLIADGVPIALGQRATAVLIALVAADGRVVTKEELLDAAWPGLVIEESNLSVQIAALRKALGRQPDDRDWIATVARVGYRFAGAVNLERDAGTPDRDTAFAVAQRPALAVLPFENLGGDASDAYLADGMTEEVITALSRFRWFSVVGRNASFSLRASGASAAETARVLGVRYVLQGSVRRAGRTVRIGVHLVEHDSARQLWSERYDTVLDDVLAVQDRIAAQVVGAIEPALLQTVSTSAVRRGQLADVDAWDLVQRGTALFHKVGQSTHLEARELFRRARELDPALPEAGIWLARVSAGLVAYGWSTAPDADLAEGVAAGLAAVQLDERNPYAHYALAITSAYGPELDRAVRAGEAAVEANPSFALGHLVLGMARLFSGDAPGARGALERGLTLNAHDPQNFVWLNLLAHACLFSDDAAAGREVAIRSLKIRPDWRPTFETQAACEEAAGNHDAARRSLERGLSLTMPSGDGLAPLRRNHPAWALQIADLLNRASR